MARRRFRRIEYEYPVKFEIGQRVRYVKNGALGVIVELLPCKSIEYHPDGSYSVGEYYYDLSSGAVNSNSYKVRFDGRLKPGASTCPEHYLELISDHLLSDGASERGSP